MIIKENLPQLLKYLKFIKESDSKWVKHYSNGTTISVNFNNQSIKYFPVDDNFKNGEYPTNDKPATGFIIHRDTTLNFSARENFVCLVCVHLLLEKGYEAKHIVFEPAFKVGHVNKQSYGDILIFDKQYKPLALIENKTFGSEFSCEWNNMQKDGGQLFSYLGPLDERVGLCENLVLFASDFDDRLVIKSHIITLKDNEKRIEELQNPLTFKNRDPSFEVWDKTYGKSFETKGLFEKDIDPYTIGKLKYTTSDLKELSHAEIRPIYHEFATILRNHAITDFEHSFYILVDLFLCKITDERNNPDDLQFYYKGISRDTPKEYCSRLLKLYQQGKKDIFGVNVVNKEESDIKQIFEDTNRSLTNGLFKDIKELFEEIKFYNIKKFNFIDVENKEEFELNFQILIKITALIQDINLSNSETNHFFGDLFEGLLSKNVHQTEGQFFTPLPIVNFIIKSLPEFENSKSVKILDYACGAGHFLTEFIKTYPNTEIYGIEKSQPLSQVAKIATIINGARDNNHIVFKDALSYLNNHEIRFQGFDENSFDCIIANPPYSVKGFLNTLTKKERDKFELFKFIDDKTLDSKRSIECFFIERAKQFLKPHGFMGIILPCSILSNGEIYTRVRELLYANFNILSVVTLGSRTFGSTGTNTIILFAQKVKKNSQGLLDTFIAKKDYKQYTNYKALDAYIEKQNYNREDYFAFMQDDILNSSLENNEIFIDYKKNFKKTPIKKSLQAEWFKKLSVFSDKLKDNSRDYKKLFRDFLNSDDYLDLEKAEYKRQFISFAKEIEKDKLNTFIQIESNEVLILQSPPDKIGGKSNKDEIIRFLGYDWSGRKGNEGIKYVVDTDKISNHDVKGVSTDYEDDDSEIIESINSIKFIKTPLYNPNDDYDCTKYAFVLRKHICIQCKNKFSFAFKSSDKLNFHSEDDKYLHYAKLCDMIDFSKTNFDKSVKINAVKEQIKIQSKFPLVKLSDIATLQKGTSITSKQLKQGKVKVVAGGIDFAYYHNVSNRPANIITVSASGANAGYVNFWKEPIFASDCTTILADSVTATKYIFYFLKAYPKILFQLQKGSAQPHVYPDDLKLLQMPYPPVDIQKLIVNKCDEFENENKSIAENIENFKNQIKELFSELDSAAMSGTKMQLSDYDCFEVSIGSRIVNTQLIPNGAVPVFSANVKKPFGYINDKLITDFSMPSVLWGIDGEWMVSYMPENREFYPTDHCGVLRCKTSMVNPRYLAHVLEVQGSKMGFSRSYRASIEKVKGISFSAPSLDVQNKFISMIMILENNIVNLSSKLKDYNTEILNIVNTNLN